MSVIFYDVLNLMSLGTARQVDTLDQLMAEADFITCHVPELAETKGMIGKPQFEKMKTGSYLINASRGTVVDIPALIDAMRSGRVAGAALDVYPNEPAGNGDYFNNELNEWGTDLRSLKNLILTPHIGGSTEEAQSAIGVEVAQALTRYVNEGTTLGAVNLPEVTLRSLTMDEPNHARVSITNTDEEVWRLKLTSLSPLGHLYPQEHSWCAAKRYGSLPLKSLHSPPKHKFSNVHVQSVNEVIGDHNVDKQMTDSRGDVSLTTDAVISIKS